MCPHYFDGFCFSSVNPSTSAAHSSSARVLDTNRTTTINKSSGEAAEDLIGIVPTYLK